MVRPTKYCDGLTPGQRAYRRYRDKGLCPRCGKPATSSGECAEHTTQRVARYKANNAMLKAEVFEHYGGYRCACCGCIDRIVLQLDHKNGGGSKQRRTEGIRAGRQFYSWLKRTGYQEDLQVLCANCNTAKGANTECPCQYQQNALLAAYSETCIRG